MSIITPWEALGKSASYIGSRFNFPEFHISEALGYEDPAPAIGPESGYTGTVDNLTYDPNLNQSGTISQQQMQNNYSFGDPSNPDLSNPVKQTDYENFLKSQGGGGSGPSEQDIINGYWSSLDSAYNDAIGSLSPLKTGQETTAGLSRDEGLRQLDTSRLENQATLDTQGRKIQEGQTSALTSLAENLRNQYQAGNVYLGARGAGDSSAAGMYAYALGRAGTKARGDVLGQTRSLQSDLGDRQASLDRLVTSEKGRIQSEYNTSLQSIGNWYNGMVSQLQQAKATDRMAMSQQILSRALGAIDDARSQAQSMSQALNQWAINNSSSIGQLNTNLKGVMNVKIPQQSYGLNAGINPMGMGSGGGSYFPGSTDNRKRDAFGNVIA